MFAPFPKIPHYRRSADAVHAVRRVVCLEKLDGTNTRVLIRRGCREPDDVVFGGRSLHEGQPGFCQPALRSALFGDVTRARAVTALSREFDADVVLYGETCGRGIQSQGFIYGSRPHFVLFAAQVAGAWLSIGTSLTIEDDDNDNTPRSLPSLRAVADGLGIPLAPCVYEGAPDEARFEELLSVPSPYAGAAGRSCQQQEGVVIWSDPVLLDGAGRLVFAKYKHPRRREAIDLDEGDEGDTLKDAATFATLAIQPERLRHARQHLVDSGRWPSVGADRAALVARRVVQDVAREVPAYQQQIAAFGKTAVRAALEARVLELLPTLEDEGA